MTTTTTLAAEIADCIACAREAGYPGMDEDYELTGLECESITDALGRKPTRQEWAEAGYPHVGDRHTGDDGPLVYRYQDGVRLRSGTADELAASRTAGKRDGGRGVIAIDGVPCYVLEGR